MLIRTVLIKTVLIRTVLIRTVLIRAVLIRTVLIRTVLTKSPGIMPGLCSPIKGKFTWTDVSLTCFTAYIKDSLMPTTHSHTYGIHLSSHTV